MGLNLIKNIIILKSITEKINNKKVDSNISILRPATCPIWAVGGWLGIPPPAPDWVGFHF